MTLPLWERQQVARCVSNHGVIAYPTESVFGLGCLPTDKQAIEKILRLKHRPIQKGVILVASAIEQILPYVLAPTYAQREQLLTTRDRPTTYLLHARTNVPVHLRGRFKTLAVRISTHPTVVSLCNFLGQPLVSTSANRAGKLPATTALGVRFQFGTTLDYIVEASVGPHQQVSDIYDLNNLRYIRKA